MRLARRHLDHWSKSALSAVLMVLVLLQMAMAASEPLHKLIHADADDPGHECAVTLFAHGHVDTATVDVPCLLPVTGLELTPPAPVSFYLPTPLELPPGRGPPSLLV